MQHSCGDGLVCDTMDIARSVCYDKGQEVKGSFFSQALGSRAPPDLFLLDRESRDLGRNCHSSKWSNYWWKYYCSRPGSPVWRTGS